MTHRPSDARQHGVEILPIDLNHSDWDHKLEPAADGAGPCSRGVSSCRRLGRDKADKLIEGRRIPYRLPQEMMFRAGIGRPEPPADRQGHGVRCSDHTIHCRRCKCQRNPHREGAGGKPLAGAAKPPCLTKCKRDACGTKVIFKNSKPFNGAAKANIMSKCKTSAWR